MSTKSQHVSPNGHSDDKKGEKWIVWMVLLELVCGIWTRSDKHTPVLKNGANNAQMNKTDGIKCPHDNKTRYTSTKQMLLGYRVLCTDVT